MQVILLQPVPGLGKADEVKEVADGYARNFLFPRHLAVPASAVTLQTLEARQAKERREAERDLKEQQRLAGQVDGLELEIKGRANQQGQLYAAVGGDAVARALQARGFPIEPKQVLLKPVKEAGSYSAKVKFRHGLEVEMTVIVLGSK